MDVSPVAAVLQAMSRIPVDLHVRNVHTPARPTGAVAHDAAAEDIRRAIVFVRHVRHETEFVPTNKRHILLVGGIWHRYQITRTGMTFGRRFVVIGGYTYYCGVLYTAYTRNERLIIAVDMLVSS